MDFLGGLFGAAGSIASASIQASAVKDAAKLQIDALNKQKDFVYQQLQPQVINEQATSADIENAKNKLALQSQIDPSLLAARYTGENQYAQQVGQIGQAPADVVAQQATNEALDQGATGVAAQMKQKLIDAAMQEMNAGATLPPDVQAELVKAGLERTGMVTGSARSTPGIGGNIVRSMIGERALALKAQRQQQAVGLTGAAQNLETSRNSLLQSLFPGLSQLQAQNQALSSGAVKTSEATMPEAGLTGQSIANIWLARVGATNQLAQSQADAASKAAMAQGSIWGQGMGAATGYGARALSSPNFSNLFASKPSTGGNSLGSDAADWSAVGGW